MRVRVGVFVVTLTIAACTGATARAGDAYDSIRYCERFARQFVPENAPEKRRTAQLGCLAAEGATKGQSDVWARNWTEAKERLLSYCVSQQRQPLGYSPVWLCIKLNEPIAKEIDG
jgi:hypothetical protein